MTAPERPGPASRDVFVAREPIFDRQSGLFGYELLFRSGLDNWFDGQDPDQASLSVIASSFFVFGIEALTGPGRAFINFTRSTLLNDCAYVLPRERLVVEILEDVEPDEEVVAACRRLKQAGYLIALDDFDQRAESDGLLDLADIVKIDFVATDEQRRAWYAHELGRRGVVLLAEKIERREDYEQALSLGYSYLQGYFFAQPEVWRGRQAPALKANRLQIMRELYQPDPDLRQVEDLVKHDPDLSYKLLRYLNSAAFGFRSPIGTVWRAITFLGQRGLRAWATVVILADYGSDRPFELVVTSVTRGRFCELIGQELGLGERCQDLFLMGLFSLLDALTGQPLDEALTGLPLSDDVHDALLGEQNRFRLVLQLAQVYERGQWVLADQLLGSLGLRSARIPSLYRDAATWGNQSRYLA